MPKNMFFLHIPKTAGTSINDYLEKQYDSPSAQHIELHWEWMKQEFWSKYSFVSGHVNIDRIREFAPKSFIVVTFLRDPWRQLLSTIRFQYAVAHPDTGHNFSYLSRENPLIDSSAKMHRFDLENPTGFQDWLSGFGWVERRLFDNFQTRFLSTVEDEVNVSEEHLDSAVRNLRTIEGVGIVERLEESIALVSRVAGFDNAEEKGLEKLNQQLVELKGLDTPEIKKLCEPLIMHDRRLYGFADRLLTDRIRFLGG